ncbi:hypothetical protein CW745_13700 [Psychromonas sp. psych-6C06]|uniref:PEP-CTERM sorting domain-containing protein n=1 Tax=Psychromonas sp. psych-6C06 TaxID=2058089 RepID=UPI000C31D963|nr:PEP-CTERM sorting domain-containing protein [Psychromonas sp. psych-6C06]PKF60583.1 hypothetical protein CW745_13700 [Psychromonas sp. psych-6C06]
MKQFFLKGVIASFALAISAGANAGLIGVWGNSTPFATPIQNAGHTFVNVNSATTLEELDTLEQVWLIRRDGDADLNNYVLNGGTLVTEWSGASWAVNSMSMLEADDSFGFASRTSVTFTQEGIDLGFTTNLPNPYSNEGATEFFRSFTGIGEGVDIIATANGYNVGIAGSYGLGNVVALGWDWVDTNALNPMNQLLVNDITGLSFSPKGVPEPGTLVIFALSLIGLASRKFKR